MKTKKKSKSSVRFNEMERISVFFERKLVMPTVHKNKKRYDKKKERQFHSDDEWN